MKTPPCRRLPACLALLATMPVLAAQDRGLLDERFNASLGTFLLSTNMHLRINGTAGSNGSVVDLEQDLGVRPGDRFRLDVNWRISGRHHLRALYFDYGSQATRSIERDLVIGEYTFPASTTVTARYSTQIVELAYEYALVRRQDWELLGTVGAHLLRFGFHASGEARIGDMGAGFSTESVSTEAPLPVVGLRHRWRMAPDWYLETQGQYFKASIDGYSGDIVDLRAGVNWIFTRHFGVGAGYSAFRTRVDAQTRHFRGRVDWRYSGAQLYVVGSF